MKNESEDKTPSFYERVYELVSLIPYGRVTTYGSIASYLGSPGSARMVGWAMNQSHQHTKDVPAHRVLNRKGMLTGKHHFGGDLMEQLLENEGIQIRDNQVLEFSKHFWDPKKELQ